MILTHNTKQILQDIKYFGGTISLKDDNLKLSFPDDFSNPDLLERIKINKSSLINFLVNENRITPTLKQTDFKATPGQKGLWFLSQFEEGSNAYHITTVFDLTGKVNPNFLEKSFQILMDRHEILRTTFYSDEEGELYQQIHEKGRLNLAFNCFEEHDFSKQEELIKTYGNALFDLGKDSLFRSVLIKIDEKGYILSLTFHHIISDGWSVSVLIKELLHIYDQLSKGGNVVLPELKIQYKDYALWLRDRVSKMELSRFYWKDKLSGELPTLDLLGYQTRPPVKTYVGNRVLLSIDKLRVEKWKETCKENNATLFMGLLSGLNAILYRYTSQQDFIIGTAITGRIHQDVINQIGFYVNTLPLRTKVTSESSFLDLLSEVKETTLEAFEHQEYPFNTILEDIDIIWDASRSPLFDCILVLQNNEKIDVESKGLKVIQRDNISKTSKYDLSFVFTENKDGELNLELEYNTDIFQQDFVKRLGTHYVNMMNTMVVNENLPICSLEYLSEQEKHQLLFEFNDTKVDYPKDKTIIDLFEEQVEKTPNNIAVVFEDVELTYTELNEKANQLGQHLREKYNIGADDLIGIKLDRSEQMIVAIFGILKSGAAYVPIDPSYPQERIDYIEKDSNTKIVIDEQELGKFYKKQEKYTKSNILKINKSKDLAYVIYTSGTTGNPKGVMVEHSNAVEFINWSKSEFNLSKFEIVYATTSYCFDLSIYEIFYTLSTGKKIRLLRNALDIRDHLENDTHVLLNTVPSVIRKLLEDNISLDNVCNINMAGEILPTDIIRKLPLDKIEIRNLYGPSEDTTYSTFYLLDKNKEYSNIPIGKPISNTQIYILDEALQPVPLGVAGKIYVSGAGVARGYFNKPELSSEKFILNPFIEGTRMYDSGDLGCWYSDGNIEFLGRKDSQVKLRGYRIELGEIENTILQFSENIKQVAVEVKENNQDKVLAAYFVSTSMIDKSVLRSFLQRSLPDYMLPIFYVAMEKLPLTPNGKIDRKALPSISGEDGIRKEYVTPTNITEKVLVAIWQEVLAIEKIGITDNFFELGGHSLMISQVINRIHKQLGKTISFKVFFANPTITALSKQLRENEYLLIPKAAETLAYPLTASQSRLWILSQLEGGSLAYNMPAAVKLNGVVDFAKFEESFQLLVDRHEILRTYFKSNEEGEVQQYILPSEKVDFKIVPKDFSKIENQEDEVAHYLQEINNKPFDLEKAPLISASLIKLEDKEYVFFLSLHHIISDGWSIELLISEIVKTYNDLIAGRRINLPELNIQYKDYAVWLNEELQQEQYIKSEQYWLQKFEGELPILDLPSFKKRPLVQTFNGGSLNHTFSKEFLEKLKKFSKEQDVTLFMTLMAGIKILLYRYSGQDDIIVGTPIAGREHPDLENQMGLFLNTLAIRTQFKEKSSFLELLITQKDNLLEAYDHQNYPFDALVNKLSLKRDMSRSSLFDVLLVLQNQSQLNNFSNNETLSNITVSDYEFRSKTSQVDVGFTFIETKKLELTIEYNTDIYDEYLIQRMFTHFENLVTKSLEQPTIDIQELDYLTEYEKQQLLFEFNNTIVYYPKNKIELLYDKHKNLSIDTPISNTQVYILDEALQLMPIGIIGKLYVSGSGLARGYLNNPELTDKQFIANPFVVGERIYDTGDLGRWLPDGNIEFLGRQDHQVKIRGYRIMLREIEKTILLYLSDLKQLVVAVKEYNQEKVLVAYFVSATNVNEAELQSFLKLKLPEYMIPSYFVELETLPLEENGNIDLKSLPEVYNKELVRNEYISPRNEMEEELVNMFQEVLGIENVCVKDDFFKLGGNSIKVVMILARIHKKFDVKIGAITFFKAPVVELLASEIKFVKSLSNKENESIQMKEISI